MHGCRCAGDAGRREGRREGGRGEERRKGWGGGRKRGRELRVEVAREGQRCYMHVCAIAEVICS